jgi:hypothetical protein
MESKIIFRSDTHAHALLVMNEEAHAACKGLVEKILAYNQNWDGLETSLFPHLKAEHHRNAIAQATCPKEIQEHGDEMSTNHDPRVAMAVSDRAKAILRTERHKIRPYAERTVSALERALEPMKAAAHRAEEEFAREHGFSHFKTPVSARIERLATRVAHLRESLNEPNHMIHSAPGRNPFKNITDFMSEPVRAAKAEANKLSFARKAAGLAVSFAGAVAAVWPK